MRGVAQQFAVVFFVGLIALAAALAYGSMTDGVFLSEQSFLVALRTFGLGWMAAGMVLWIILRREEGGRPEISLPLGLMVVLGCVLLVLAVFLPFVAAANYLMWVGLVLNLAALAVGVLAMLFTPAYPKPVTIRWPEGGEDHTDIHVPATDLRVLNTLPGEPDDLTRIEGIGPKAQEALRQAGITTFAGVADCSPQDLKKALKAAKFRTSASIESWPRQAGLAARGDWDGLKALQDQLKAGRSVR
ncbi:MAG: hypothetical protein JXB30_16710 [Anaerolineae bacterium]|nr:hypothetical protein [Anaerolineae bacterium]